VPSEDLTIHAIASYLLAAAAFIILSLGTLHLLFTFHGDKLHPRDPALIASMKEVSPRITRETTMWKTWIGFNASHSYCGMLFGLIYGYLALRHPDFLFASAFLLSVGLLLLAGLVFLGWRYWFSTPFRGIVLATALYVAAIVMRFL
jgi:hypothetical protein